MGSEIERRIRYAAVWVPSKDTGIDLLVTSARTNRPVSLQVKYSRDYSMQEAGLVAFGWWTLNRERVRQSKADLWVFVLLPFEPRRGLERRAIQYVIVPPGDLAERLRQLHGRKKRLDTYLAVTPRRKCWEARGLTVREKALVAAGQDAHIHKARDFTRYLNAWWLLTQKLGRRR